MWSEAQAEQDEEKQWLIERWDQEEFNRLLVRKETAGFFEIPEITEQGEKYWYLDWRKALANEGLALVVRRVQNFMASQGIEAGCAYGISPNAAYSIAPMLTGQLAQNIAVESMPANRIQEMLNSDPVLASQQPTGTTVILDESTGTGERIVKGIEALLGRPSVYITGVIGLIDFKQKRGGKTVQEVVRQRGVEYFAMTAAQTLFRMAYERADALGRKPTDDIAKAVEQDFARYGIEVKLL